MFTGLTFQEMDLDLSRSLCCFSFYLFISRIYFYINENSGGFFPTKKSVRRYHKSKRKRERGEEVGEEYEEEEEKT